MDRYASLSSTFYAAAVRMRADVGSYKMRSVANFRRQLIDDIGWAHVRRRVELVLAAKSGVAASSLHAYPERSEIVTCHRPANKRGDVCFWSAPADPLRRTVTAMRNGGLVAIASDAACAQHLSSHRPKIPLFSENLLICAMHQAGVNRSGLFDSWELGGPECTRQGVPLRYRWLGLAASEARAVCWRRNVTGRGVGGRLLGAVPIRGTGTRFDEPHSV